MDPVSDIKSKEIKRASLNELVDYITATRGVLNEPVYPEIVKMVGVTFLLTIMTVLACWGLIPGVNIINYISIEMLSGLFGKVFLFNQLHFTCNVTLVKYIIV